MQRSPSRVPLSDLHALAGPGRARRAGWPPAAASGATGWRPVSFMDRDHLGGAPRGIADSLRACVQARGPPMAGRAGHIAHALPGVRLRLQSRQLLPLPSTGRDAGPDRGRGEQHLRRSPAVRVAGRHRGGREGGPEDGATRFWLDKKLMHVSPFYSARRFVPLGFRRAGCAGRAPAWISPLAASGCSRPRCRWRAAS